jgi:molybdenum cofactor biosynthesis enzyme MoaA
VDLIEFGAPVNAEVRFIEYMDVGGATHWSMPRVVSRAEMLERSAALRPDHADRRASSAPADRYRLPDGTTFGIIASTTEPFCSDCDRSRLTADGMWYLCLYAPRGIDLRGPLRAGASAERPGRNHPHWLGGAGGSRRRASVRVPGSLATDPGRHATPRPASGDAYTRRVTSLRCAT